MGGGVVRDGYSAKFGTPALRYSVLFPVESGFFKQLSPMTLVAMISDVSDGIL
jgi:hypothetical protein